MGENRQAFGRQLRRLRRLQDLTQEQLAERARLHPTYVSRMESGKSLPALDVLLRLARALEVSLADLTRPLEAAEQGEEREGHSLREVRLLLEGCSPGQLALVRDFIVMVRERGHCDR